MLWISFLFSLQSLSFLSCAFSLLFPCFLGYHFEFPYHLCSRASLASWLNPLIVWEHTVGWWWRNWTWETEEGEKVSKAGTIWFTVMRNSFTILHHFGCLLMWVLQKAWKKLVRMSRSCGRPYWGRLSVRIWKFSEGHPFQLLCQSVWAPILGLLWSINSRPLSWELFVIYWMEHLGNVCSWLGREFQLFLRLLCNHLLWSFPTKYFILI